MSDQEADLKQIRQRSSREYSGGQSVPLAEDVLMAILKSLHRLESLMVGLHNEMDNLARREGP